MTGSATGSGPVTVASGARLAGNGFIAPTAGSVGVSGTLQPGTDLSTGNLTITGNASISGTASKYRWSLSGAGTASDTPITNGESDVGSTTSRLVVNGDLAFQPDMIDVVGLGTTGFNNQRYYSWTVATRTTFHSIAKQPTFNTEGLNAGGGSFTLSVSGGSVFVSFTPTPEPASILLGCAVTAAVVRMLRRRLILADA